MIATLIGIINNRFSDNLNYLTELNGLSREAVKYDGKKKIILPAVVNDLECSTDQEKYIVLKREKKSVVWWEIINEINTEYISSKINKHTCRVRMYVWLNTGIINKSKPQASSWFGDFFTYLPVKITGIEYIGILNCFIKNPSFKTSGKEFKKYSFNEMLDVSPYAIFCIDMELEIMASCFVENMIKNYNKCEEEIS